MEKRKRRADRNKTPPSPALLSHAYHMESSSKEKSPHSGGAEPTSSSSSLTNMMERSPHVNHQSSSHHRHHNVNRGALSLRGPRHYYNVQHSQRNNNNHGGTSTSHGKSTVRDDKHSWKFDHKHEPGFGYSAGRRDKASRRLDRIRSNPVVMEFISPEVVNMFCGLCQQKMSDNSVVAVLVCGHIYHVDCLEIRTSNDDRRDPPCPLCIPSAVNN